MEPVFQWISHYGYAGLFAALMFGIAGLPIPDETILVFCGYLIAVHRLDASLTFITGVLGSVCGITLSYGMGRTAGQAIVERYGKYIHLTPEMIARVNSWFHRMGEWLLTFGYFILGVRHFTALVAGMSGLEFSVFARFAYLGAAIWVATFLAIGYLVGDNWPVALVLVHRYSWLLAGLLVIGVAVWYLIARRRRNVRQ